MQIKAPAPPANPDRKMNRYLILFTVTFIAFLAVLFNYGDLAVLQNPLTLLMVGLAAFRGGRALAYNQIFHWLRAPFTQVVDDSSGAGASIQARGQGLQRVIGDLLSCPICAGTWAALFLSALLVLIYPFGLVLTFVLAASGVGELLHWHAERDEWQGRAAREESGTAWLTKNVDRRSKDDDRGLNYPVEGSNVKVSPPAEMSLPEPVVPGRWLERA